MGFEHYSFLKINVDRRVAFVTIDHPPFNLMDMALIQELDLLQEVQDIRCQGGKGRADPVLSPTSI
jgi:hypothetical protein